MTQDNRPDPAHKAADPSDSYERSHPENEAGMGCLDCPDTIPQAQPSGMDSAVRNSHAPRQINADETDSPEQERLPHQPDHSMNDEEPTGWDQAPNDIHNPRHKRHPRTEGKGGLA